MPMQKKGSKEECISYNYKEMIAAGHPKDQAQAAALNFCGKQWGGISKKKNKNEDLKYDILFELIDLKIIDEKLQEEKKWMQKAVKEKNVGKTTAECKRMGYDGVTSECLQKLKKRGGKWAQRANFAINAKKVSKKNQDDELANQ